MRCGEESNERKAAADEKLWVSTEKKNFQLLAHIYFWLNSACLYLVFI
jgi:hypothetical protein